MSASHKHTHTLAIAAFLAALPICIFALCITGSINDVIIFFRVFAVNALSHAFARSQLSYYSCWSFLVESASITAAAKSGWFVGLLLAGGCASTTSTSTACPNVRLAVVARNSFFGSVVFCFTLFAACLCSFVRQAFAFVRVRFAVASNKQRGGVINVHKVATIYSSGDFVFTLFVLLDIARSFGWLSCLLLVF